MLKCNITLCCNFTFLLMVWLGLDTKNTWLVLTTNYLLASLVLSPETQPVYLPQKLRENTNQVHQSPRSGKTGRI